MSTKSDESKTYDPLDMWRTSTGAMLEACLTASAPVRETLAANMAEAMRSLNLPSRAEVAGLAERMAGIEARLDDLDAKLDAALRRRTGASERRAAARRQRRDGNGIKDL